MEPAGRRSRQRFDHAIQTIQFAGGVDLGMAGQDLLDERAAGAGHAEDEDRHRRGIARRCQAVEQVGRRTLGNQPEISLIVRFVVMRFRCVSERCP